MGSVIATALGRRGYSVVGWDVAPERRAAVQTMGCEIAPDLPSLFATCDRVLLSLPSHETVARVLWSSGITLRAGQTIVDTSTGDPAAAISHGVALADLAVDYLDATVSGSSVQLADRQAVFLVGGAEPVVARCGDLFEALADKFVHTGPLGSGAKVKLVSNLVLGLNRAALAEGLCLARSLGLDLRQTLSLLRESLAYSRIMDSKGEKMITGDFQPQARLSQHLKDVHLMLASARETGVTLPLTETHRQLLERAEGLGLGELDNSAIIQALDHFAARDTIP